ncbi:MAG TPA: RagB/SusD family nutrient uptake outer membrane protein [Pedobacter sp.]
MKIYTQHIKRYLKAGKAFGGMVMLFLLLNTSCKKFVEVDSLTDKLLSEQVYQNDATANAATAGIYRQLRTSNFMNFLALYSGMISDEVSPGISTAANTSNYVNNTLSVDDTGMPWNALYSVIYSANSVIEGLTNNKALSDKAQQYYMGEAKFNRAFCYFYLVNLYGDVPLVLSSDVKTNSLIARSAVNDVYAQIISDLKDAQNGLGNDYSFTGGDRSRADKWVATALLARVYLYQKDWANALALSTAVINSGQYSLLNAPAGILNKNNTEAIYQLANNSTETNAMATFFIFTSTPNYLCSDLLLNSFETNDLRKTTWIKTQLVSGTPASIPFKFTTIATNSNEWLTFIRLGEIYLIRAEARAMQNDLQGAISDVNLLRQKHGGLNTALPVPADQASAVDVILHERRVDLFTEGCFRWLDLKRTGKIDAVMLQEKPTTWTSTAALFPIPFVDIQRNPKLVQNPGYKQ